MQLKFNGRLVEDMYSRVFYMRDLRLTMASRFLGRMAPKFYATQKVLKSFIILNGSLMKQEYCQNPI